MGAALPGKIGATPTGIDVNPTSEERWGEAPPCREFALQYAERGWLVVPIWSSADGICKCRDREHCDSPGKHPRHRRGHKGSSKDAKKVRSWKWETANIGIATGPDSGLLVVDIDPRNGGDRTWDRLIGELGQLPVGPSVKTGGGGWHYYFRCPSQETRKPSDWVGIDIKAGGGLVVAPPSVHVSGKTYQWASCDRTSVPDLPTTWLAALGATALVTETTEDNEGQRKTTERTPGGGGPSAQFPPNLDTFVEQCIQETLPQRPGERHRSVFELARYLKADPYFASGSLQDLQAVLHPIVERWYEYAQKQVGADNIKDTIDDNWIDFAEGWGRVKCPARPNGKADIMDTLFERAKAAAPPPVARQFKTEEKILLVKLCRELDRFHNQSEFPLATTVVARLFGVPANQRMTVHRWLVGLESVGILECVERGNSRKASRYSYCGD